MDVVRGAAVKQRASVVGREGEQIAMRAIGVVGGSEEVGSKRGGRCREYNQSTRRLRWLWRKSMDVLRIRIAVSGVRDVTYGCPKCGERS